MQRLLTTFLLFLWCMLTSFRLVAIMSNYVIEHVGTSVHFPKTHNKPNAPKPLYKASIRSRSPYVPRLSKKEIYC
jgi:hypothetical protein